MAVQPAQLQLPPVEVVSVGSEFTAPEAYARIDTVDRLVCFYQLRPQDIQCGGADIPEPRSGHVKYEFVIRNKYLFGYRLVIIALHRVYAQAYLVILRSDQTEPAIYLAVKGERGYLVGVHFLCIHAVGHPRHSENIFYTALPEYLQMSLAVKPAVGHVVYYIAEGRDVQVLAAVDPDTQQGVSVSA